MNSGTEAKQCIPLLACWVNFQICLLKTCCGSHEARPKACANLRAPAHGHCLVLNKPWVSASYVSVPSAGDQHCLSGSLESIRLFCLEAPAVGPE